MYRRKKLLVSIVLGCLIILIILINCNKTNSSNVSLLEENGLNTKYKVSNSKPHARIVPKSWIFLRNYNIYEKDYESKDFSTIYVYDVSPSDQIIMKEYSSNFFHNPYTGISSSESEFRWGQVGNYLFVLPTQFEVPGDYNSLFNYIVYIYEIRENAELEEINSFDLRDYMNRDNMKHGFWRFQFRLLENTLELAIEEEGLIEINYFEISDMHVLKFMRKETVNYSDYLRDIWFIDLTAEEQNKLFKLDLLEDYYFLLPDRETVIHYKYKPEAADIAPVIGNINDGLKKSKNLKFCTGVIPESFDGMRQTRIFGNTLVKFLNNGCVAKYTVDYDGTISAYTKVDIYKAIDERNYSDLKKFSIQCKEYYETSILNKIINTDDEKLFREYLGTKHRYEYSSPIFDIVSSGHEKAIRLAFEINPEWLNKTIETEKSWSYSYGVMDKSPNTQISKLLKELGAPQKISFRYTVYAGEECYAYVNPGDKSPALKVPKGNDIFSKNRVFVYDKTKDSFSTWIELMLINDPNTYYILWGNGSWNWGDRE